MRGALMVCGTTSDAGKSFVAAGLCRLLARQGVRVAPFKGQNMANNAAVTGDGAEIGHAQWVQAVAAGVAPTAAMNPVLLKPTSERTSQVVVEGKVWKELDARSFHAAKASLRPVVLAALNSLRASYDVVICEGAGSPAEINLLDDDLVNLGLADAAGVPAIVVGDIDRGGVFASIYGTVELLPDDLRARVAGFVINRLRGDPSLLGSACSDLAARIGVPCLGVLPMLPGTAFDAEDSLALDHPDSAPSGSGDVLDVAAVRWPLVANAGDVDPLRLEPRVHVRWVRSVAELGRPDLVFLPGSKSTRADLSWFRSSGLAGAVERLAVPVVAVCAGLQMAGELIDDPDGVEGPPGRSPGLGWLPVTSAFVGDKVLDRPVGRAVDGPGSGSSVGGYRIHHGRVRPTGAAFADGMAPWLVADDDSLLGWHRGHLCGTTLHGLFEDDAFRSGVLGWAAAQSGKQWSPSGVSFAAARLSRLDAIADALETHLDMGAVTRIISSASSSKDTTP